MALILKSFLLCRAEPLPFHGSMDIRNWCSSGSSETLRLGRDPSRSSIASSTSSAAGSKKLGWKELWMRLRERRKMFESNSSLHEPYDSNTYMQNFDHGFVWEEPDNLSRSFSVRFADPSRISGKKIRMVKSVGGQSCS